MSYRVFIPTAGTGSRLKDLTKYINKSLVAVANRPTIAHLIEQFPNDCDFVIALGHKGELVKDFLELAFSNKKFIFEWVHPFEGEGSGLGFSLLSCQRHLEQPFVFLSCDTLFKGYIPEPDHNWIGYAESEQLLNYRTLEINQNILLDICEKGVLKKNLWPYPGIAGIYDHQLFWKKMNEGGKIAVLQGETYGIRYLLDNRTIKVNKFEWYDTGNLEALSLARDAYKKPNEPNILEKKNEAIWFVGDNVIKYSDDKHFINNRVKRSKELKGFVPDIVASNNNMYLYKKIKGEVLSEVVTITIFKKFLKRIKSFWAEKNLTLEDKNKFKRVCYAFYKEKTIERLNLFYKNFNKTDNVEFINEEPVPPLQILLNKVDWNWLSEGLPGRFHGDFHFENILYSKQNKNFTFLDWRQDFGGNLSTGDIYYDLAKLNHGLIVNHGIIIENRFSALWKDNKIGYKIERKKILEECEHIFDGWMEENNFETKKVRVLTGLIYLNIAALHHYPYSILLYALGKKILKEEIK
tara:strand:- start:1534 stop:3099 length:1566 start_codon:yes stop_codon:yes gene_type:complete